MPKSTDKGQELMVPDENGNIMAILRLAVETLGGEGAEAAVAAVERLVDLKLKVDAKNAQKEFNEELSAFQNECSSIVKNSVATVTTKSGGQYTYKYAKLAEIERTVKPLLMPRGFSYSWDSETTEKQIKVTCHLRHSNGHEITASATAPIPDSLAAMNIIQIPASVRTYLERGTLIQVLGLTTADEDIDAVNGQNGERLNADQVEKIRKIMDDSLPPDAATRFLKYLKVNRIEDIPAASFDSVLKLLAQKKKQYEAV
jgi:hypothetical protein